MVRRVADLFAGFSVSGELQDAVPGENVLLLNYETLPAVASPYRSRHAIDVREYAK